MTDNAETEVPQGTHFEVTIKVPLQIDTQSAAVFLRTLILEQLPKRSEVTVRLIDG